jgi:S1-C subfamily serine protease
MNPVSTSQRPAIANLLAGLLGGLVVLVLGAVLIATDVIDTGDTERVTRSVPVTQPSSDGGDDGGRTVEDIYRREGRGVVFVEARGVSEGSPLFGLPPQEGTATGSGFVVDRDGSILTNAHVVAGSDDVSVTFNEDDGPVDAEVKGRDPSTDLALLQVDPDDVKGLTPLPLGDSSKVEVGEPAIAIGNPFGFSRTVTTGIVSALQRQITAPNGFSIPNVIQTDASVNPGNSGGPLLDGAGRVIGINSQIATGGGEGSVGIAFAVPINTAKGLLPQLKEGGEIERAYLGVNMVDVTERLAEDLNLAVDEGALIQSVDDGGPADDAGLRGGRTPTGEGISAGGDLLVEVDGEKVQSGDDVAAAITDDKPGDEIEVEYYRGDDKRTATVKLGERPSRVQTEAPEAPEGPEDLFPLP